MSFICCHTEKVNNQININFYTLPDQPLLPREREALKSSDEMFAQMSCIEPVTTRLCGRGVLHRDAGKRVLDCLKQYGTKEGASRCYDSEIKQLLLGIYF